MEVSELKIVDNGAEIAHFCMIVDNYRDLFVTASDQCFVAKDFSGCLQPKRASGIAKYDSNTTKKYVYVNSSSVIAVGRQ